MPLASEKVTVEMVVEEIDVLGNNYRRQRKAVLASLSEPYQKQRRKLQRLLDVLLAEKGPQAQDDDLA